MDRRSMTVAGEPVRITSNGRRYFSKSHKEAVIAKCLAPGASLSAVALANGFNANLVRKWVRQHAARQAKASAKLLPVALDAQGLQRLLRPVAQAQLVPGPSEAGSIRIRLGQVEVAVHGLVDREQLALVLDRLLRAR